MSLASYLSRPKVIHQWFEAGMDIGHEGLPACIDSTQNPLLSLGHFNKMIPEKKKQICLVFICRQMFRRPPGHSTSAKVPVAIQAGYLVTSSRLGQMEVEDWKQYMHMACEAENKSIPGIASPITRLLYLAYKPL